MFYKDKRVNPPDWLNYYKCVCASNNTASKEAKIDRIKEKMNASQLDLKIWMHLSQ